MKQLLILRHGKSDWSDPSLLDHDRPLKGRGKRATRRMGEVIRERAPIPDRIISSSAKRARMSAKRAANAIGGDIERVTDERLYMTGVKAHIRVILECVRESDDCVMIVGHNPDLEDLVSRLCNRSVLLKTADLACIEFDIDAWSELPSTRGVLRFLARARDHE